jgi:PEP-CTERM motif
MFLARILLLFWSTVSRFHQAALTLSDAQDAKEIKMANTSVVSEMERGGKVMKRHVLELLLLFGILVLAMPANAALIITPSTDTPLTGNDPSQAVIDGIIDPLLGSSTELYKQDAGVIGDSGTLAGSYETGFNGDLSGGTIEYVGGDIVGPIAYLLVKDGNQEPAWYFYNMTADPINWNGMETIVLSSFWPENGSISHVTLYGNSTSVPEAGTLLLFGSGLIGLVGYRRVRRMQ